MRRSRALVGREKYHIQKKGVPRGQTKGMPPAEALNNLYEIVVDEQGFGRLKMRVDCPWHRNGKKAGEFASRGVSNGYRTVRFYGTMYREHRLIWKMVHGAEPRWTIDHIDRNKLNNNPKNLRDVPDIENIWNRRPRLEHRHIYPANNQRGYVVSLPRLAFSTLDDAKTFRNLMVKVMLDLANKFNRSRVLSPPKEHQDAPGKSKPRCQRELEERPLSLC